MLLFASIHCCPVVTCWERADLLALFCDIYCVHRVDLDLTRALHVVKIRSNLSLLYTIFSIFINVCKSICVTLFIYCNIPSIKSLCAIL